MNHPLYTARCIDALFSPRYLVDGFIILQSRHNRAPLRKQLLLSPKTRRNYRAIYYKLRQLVALVIVLALRTLPPARGGGRPDNGHRCIVVGQRIFRTSLSSHARNIII